jgi:hypothetical protein
MMVVESVLRVIKIKMWTLLNGCQRHGSPPVFAGNPSPVHPRGQHILPGTCDGDSWSRHFENGMSLMEGMDGRFAKLCNGP